MRGDILSSWAADTARALLTDLPRRLKHTQGVARQAERCRGIVDDPDILVAAAWLHDIGYAPQLAHSGFHPLDGAQYLARRGTPERLCALVAHHSCARVEARQRQLDLGWLDEQSPLRDALWWADMTTTPDGDIISAPRRIEEIHRRYGPDHIVSQSIAEATPLLLDAVADTERLLSESVQV